MNATITRKSRNLGIAATSSITNTAHGWHFDPLESPMHTGGCATIVREARAYRRLWSGGTEFRMDFFVGGRRVSHDDGSHQNLWDFCADYPDYDHGYRDQSITVTLEDGVMTELRPKPETKRLKHYRLRTNLDNEAGRLLDRLAADAKMSRTTWIEVMIRETAKQKVVTEPT